MPARPRAAWVLGAGGMKHIFLESEFLKLEVMKPEKQPTWPGPRTLHVQGQNRLSLGRKAGSGPHQTH